MHVVAFADHAFMRNWLPLVTSADKKGVVTLEMFFMVMTLPRL